MGIRARHGRRFALLRHTEGAIPHLYKRERERPTPVRRRLSRTHAVLGRAIPRRCVPVSGTQVRSLVVLCKNQGCGVGGKISDSNTDFDLFKISDSNSGFSKFPTPTFPKFLNPTPQHTGKEIWLLKSMEIVVHSKKPLFLQKFQKKLYHFNRNSRFRSVL